MKFFRPLSSKLVLAATLLATGLSFQIANADTSLSTVARTAQMDAVVTAVGAGGKIKIYGDTGSGCAIPSGVAAAPVGCTLQATLTLGSVIGTVSSGVLTVGSVTQSNASHVAGTPRFFHITTSADAIVQRMDACGSAPCWTFTGTVATGQNVTLTGVTITAGNP